MKVGNQVKVNPRQLFQYIRVQFKYDSSNAMGKLFDLEEEGYFYTRLQNPHQ